MHGGAERPAQLTGDEIRRRISDITRLRLAGHLNQLMGISRKMSSSITTAPKRACSVLGFLTGERNSTQSAADRRRISRSDGEIADILVEAIWRRSAGAHVGGTVEQGSFTGWKWLISCAGKTTSYRNARVSRHSGATILGRSVLRSFEDLMEPRPPGLTREEILERVRALADFLRRKAWI